MMPSWPDCLLVPSKEWLSTDSEAFHRVSSILDRFGDTVSLSLLWGWHRGNHG